CPDGSHSQRASGHRAHVVCGGGETDRQTRRRGGAQGEGTDAEGDIIQGCEDNGLPEERSGESDSIAGRGGRRAASACDYLIDDGGRRVIRDIDADVDGWIAGSSIQGITATAEGAGAVPAGAGHGYQG